MTDIDDINIETEAYDDKSFLKRIKSPSYYGMSVNPPKIKRTSNRFKTSDNVDYGLVGTLTYARGVAENTLSPPDDLEGFVLKMVPRHGTRSKGPPTLPKTGIGRSKIN